MNNRDDVLYLFLHIPKTAGITFLRHVKYNYASKTLLAVGPKPDMKFNHCAEVDAYIDSLPQKRKDQVRFVSGHSVYYGIHGHFQKRPRYFTFLRDPVKRTISNFNYFMQNYDVFVEEDNELFPQNRDELTFDRWWDCFQHNMQAGVVLNYRHDDRPGWDPELRLDESHLEEAKRILDDFYFVGLTETFQEDSMFLYGKLGITSFFKERQNVMSRSFLTVTDDVKKRIAKDAALDIELYEHAIDLNRRFKIEHERFAAIVRKTESDRKFVTPLRFIVADAVRAVLGIRRTQILVAWVSKTVQATLRILGVRRG